MRKLRVHRHFKKARFLGRSIMIFFKIDNSVLIFISDSCCLDGTGYIINIIFASLLITVQ
jgi:hypothetical protein